MGKTRIMVDCVDQRLVVTNDPLVASGGRNEDEIAFSFCPLWEGFGKTAVFYRTIEDVYNSPIVDDRCVIPAEVLAEKGVIYFGVFGVNDDTTRTSEVIKYNVVQGAQLGKEPAEPTPDIYSQLMTRLGDVDQQLKDIENKLNPEGVGAVSKSGDTMTGALTTTGLNVTPGNKYPTTMLRAIADGDSVAYGAAMNDEFMAQIIYEAANKLREYYLMPKYTAGRTDDAWYSILTSKTPVTIAQGGTGVQSLAGIQSTFLKPQSIAADADVLTLPNGFYHTENQVSMEVNNWPYDSSNTRAEVVVFGNRNGDSGYYLVVVVEMWSGTIYINRRTWSTWSGWTKIVPVAVE